METLCSVEAEPARYSVIQKGVAGSRGQGKAAAAMNRLKRLVYVQRNIPEDRREIPEGCRNRISTLLDEAKNQ